MRGPRPAWGGWLCRVGRALAVTAGALLLIGCTTWFGLVQFGLDHVSIALNGTSPMFDRVSDGWAGSTRWFILLCFYSLTFPLLSSFRPRTRVDIAPTIAAMASLVLLAGCCEFVANLRITTLDGTPRNCVYADCWPVYWQEGLGVPAPCCYAYHVDHAVAAHPQDPPGHPVHCSTTPLSHPEHRPRHHVAPLHRARPPRATTLLTRSSRANVTRSSRAHGARR